MEYRQCLNCAVMIDARLVFCTVQCRDTYHACSGPAVPRQSDLELSAAIMTRLEFVRWSRAQRWAQFREEITNPDVVALS